MEGHEQYLWPFLALFLLDGALTAWGVGHGWVKEVNPFMAHRAAWQIMASKLLWAVPLWWIGRYLWTVNPRMGRVTLIGLNAVMVLVTGWVLFVILHELNWLATGNKFLG